ncbi:MAG: UDP-N-acetylmuramoyl-L-alanine--D-glutamate ligase [Burkholderia sp.]
MFGDRQRLMVLVLGLGDSGLAIARWCARYACPLRIADTRKAPPNLTVLREAVDEVEFVGGVFSPALLDGGIELIALSPGLSRQEPALTALFAVARERDIPVWGELEFFARALAALAANGYAPKVLAITGTNGKTTTTGLTGLLCERAGRSVAVAGNISPAMLDKLSNAIDAATLPDVWVLELSSFQLDSSESFAPDAATVLNITQDHLDWHGSFEAYTEAKARIFGPNTVRVLNRGDAEVMKLMPPVADNALRIVTFGLDEPSREGDYGLARANGISWLVEAVDLDGNNAPVSPRRSTTEMAAVPNLASKRLIPTDALHIRGLHNAANALAAFALARAIKLPPAALLHGLREYRGVAHRVELIASLAGVDYVDDSKGTNVGATVAALTGLAKRTVLIAGGEGKGQEFTPLALPVARWCRAVMLIGRDAPLIRKALAETGVPLVDHATLEAAVQAASVMAEPGDVVLLSPACASFDMFNGYAHRAAVFRSALEDITLDRDTML